jgi:hypothetical protein
MDDRRALTDEALDREIDLAVRVDPSPEFVARVRTRVADEQAPSRWRLGWCIAAAAAAVVVVGALLLNRATAPQTTETETALLAARPLPNSVIWNAELGMRNDMRVTTSAAGPIPNSKLRIPHSAIASTPVIIDPREAAALHALIARARRGLELSPILSTPAPAAMDLPPVADIVIPPLAIEPLAPESGAQGERK